MRKMTAMRRAVMQSYSDQAPVEVWSRPQTMPEGVVRPRAPRNWILRSQKDETDQDILDRRAGLLGRGFRFERLIEEGGQS